MPLQLEIVTPEGSRTRTRSTRSSCPGSEGELGVLPHHAPLRVDAGRRASCGSARAATEESFAIVGGFLQVRPDKVVVMAETADMASEIDLEKAAGGAARGRAGARVAATTRAPTWPPRARRSQQALLRIRVAERRHREASRGSRVG